MFEKNIFPNPESNFRRASRHSLEVYAEYDTGERGDLVEHAERVVGLMDAFAGDVVPPEAVSLVYLHDVVDRLLNTESTKHTPEREAAAKEAMLDFFTDPTLGSKRAKYAVCLLPDMVWTEQASGRHRKGMANRAYNGDDTITPEVIQMMSEQYTGNIPPEVWRKVEPLLEFDYMRRFVKNTNIESLLVKMCELADNMSNPSSRRESAWLQDSLEAESFYAPSAEALGFDGLAATLRSEASMLRLRGQGKEEYITEAEAVLNKIADVGIESIVSQILGGDEDTCAVAPAVGVNTETGEVPMHIGEFAIDTGSSGCLAGNYRLKTVGSLAKKMARYEGGMPSDIVGLMVISEDVATSARDFAHFIESRLPQFTPYLAKSKDKQIYIQGSEEYVAAVTAELQARGFDEECYQTNVQTKEEAAKEGYGKYEVSKVTFSVNHDGTDVPTEVQFLTKAERKRSRYGEVAHLIYKYLSYFPDISAEERERIIRSAVETLEDMYDRKRHLSKDSLEVNERSVANAEPLLVALAA